MSVATRSSSPARHPRWGGLAAALLLTLERPGAWAVALAGFLARGGLLLMLLPIVALPTPAGIQAELAPLLVPLAFGQVADGLSVLVAVISGAVLVALLAGGLVGAWADARLAALAIEEPDAPVGRLGLGTAVDLLLARLVAHVPLALALGWGAARIVEVGYAELVRPFEVVTPLAVRIISGAPIAVVLVGLAWLLGEAAGGLATREVLLRGRGSIAAAVGGWFLLLRHPAASLGVVLATSAVALVTLLPGLLAAGAAWSQVRIALFDGAGPLEQWLAVSLFSAVWLGALVLAAAGVAFRQYAWTLAWRRHARPAPVASVVPAWRVGTIGDGEATRPGG